MGLRFLLLVFAFVLFVVASFPPASAHWSRLVSAGLACWIATLIFF